MKKKGLQDSAKEDPTSEINSVAQGLRPKDKTT